MPLRRMGMSRWKSFVWAIFRIGRAYCSCFRGFCSYTPILPYALAFAAGAMIFVVVEVIPETQQDNNTDITMGFVGIYCYDGLGCCSWVGI
jgi:ZIP family zinc transporter